MLRARVDRDAVFGGWPQSNVGCPIESCCESDYLITLDVDPEAVGVAALVEKAGIRMPPMMNALVRLPVSTLCDVDKALPVADPAIRPITASARLCGPAYTVVAADEFLSTLWAINDAAPGDVLVVQTGGSLLAALGELLAAEAYRQRL